MTITKTLCFGLSLSLLRFLFKATPVKAKSKSKQNPKRLQFYLDQNTAFGEQNFVTHALVFPIPTPESFWADLI